MTLAKLKDSDLLAQIKTYVQSERDVLVKILDHLREIERRRLFSDLGYSSLFDYAVKELKYSEGQAVRRIQAMRLLKELPELEPKIASGVLSLSNVQQAHSFFRNIESTEPNRIVTPKEKLEIFAHLEDKSVRDAQKELLKINPAVALPKEKERVITETSSEVRFLMTDTLKAKLEGVRSLLGAKGTTMTYAELFDVMSDLSLQALESKKFGKKRVAAETVVQEQNEQEQNEQEQTNPPPTQAVKAPLSTNARYIPKSLKHQVWRRDHGKCTNCQSKRNLNYDHVTPVALGGASTLENLRLLCFQCNQRASAKIFGTRPTGGNPALSSLETKLVKRSSLW